jgi:hypothetical protein
VFDLVSKNRYVINRSLKNKLTSICSLIFFHRLCILYHLLFLSFLTGIIFADDVLLELIGPDLFLFSLCILKDLQLASPNSVCLED